MNSPAKSIALVVVTLAALILGVLNWQQRHQLRALETAVAQATAERDAARSRATESERLLTAESEPRPPTPGLPTATGIPPTPAFAASGSPRRFMAAPMALDSEAAQQAMATSLKASLDQRYGSLFRRLKLSPSDLDRLKDLLAEKQLSRIDVLRAAQEQGLSPGTHQEELNALISSVHEDIDSGIRALLGDEGFAQLEEFNDNVEVYGLFDQVERRLSYTNAPLQDNQADALLRALLDAAPPSKESPASEMNGVVRVVGPNGAFTSMMGAPRVDDQTLAAARAVLSPEQMQVIEQIHAEQQSMRAAFPGAGGGPPIPAVAGQRITLPGPIPLPSPSSSGP